MRRVCLLMVLCLSALGAVPAAAQTIALPASGTRLPAGDDFATTTFGDAWEMANVEDVAAYPVGTQGWQSVGGVSGGKWTGTTNAGDAFVSLLHQGQWPGTNYEFATMHVGRYGVNTPIDASVYRKLSIKFRTTTPGEIVGVHWFKSLHYQNNAGGRFLHWGTSTTVGSQVVKADLTSPTGVNPQYGDPWSGSIMGLRLDPNELGTGNMLFEMDWVRLTRGDSDPDAVRQRVAWSGATAQTVVEVLDAQGDTVDHVGTGASGDVTWFYGHLPPGAYTLRLRNGGSTLTTSSFTINAPPIVHVLDPDETGGADWATEVKGNPWDMNGATDIMLAYNATGGTYTTDAGHSVYRAISAASGGYTGDPSVFLVTNGTPAVDAARYHRFSFRMKVTHNSPEDWVTARLLFGKDAANSSILTNSQDIMVWNNEYRTFSVDLATLTSGPGLEPGMTQAGTWGGTVRWMRFDPLEYPQATEFQIDEMKLAADDETSDGLFLVRWQATDTDSGDAPVVTLFYDTDRNPSSGLVQIAGNVPASQGAYGWNASNVTPGVYYVYASITDGVQSTGRYSTGPVRVLASPVPTAAALADFSGDGRAELAVFRPALGSFLIQGASAQASGSAGDVPVPGDYDGDLTAEAATWSPATGVWKISGAADITWGAPGDVPVPADYNGDGRVDPAVFRRATGQWLIRNVGTFVFGVARDIPVPADYDGDGDADIAVFERATGQWKVYNGPTTAFGLASDVPLPGDYDGDGAADVAVYRPSSSTFYVLGQLTRAVGVTGDLPLALDVTGDRRVELIAYRRATGLWTIYDSALDATTTRTWGAGGDIPAGRRPQLPVDQPGDHDGDAKGDPTVFRPASGTWYSLLAATGYGTSLFQAYGLSTDRLAPGDFLGHGRVQRVVFRNGTWYVSGGPILQFGQAGDLPVARDFDGDGRYDHAVYRAGAWFVRPSGGGAPLIVAFGLSTDIPVPADYDGDGRADIAVYRNGTWWVRRSGGGTTSFVWGLSTDVPVPADYDGDGRTDYAVFRPSSGAWYIRYATGASSTTAWGMLGDVPVAVDYNGDGVADLAVFRSGTWYLRSLATLAWGTGTDVQAVKP